MKIVGILLIVFGLVDFIGSWLDFDLWGTMGVELPRVIHRFSAYIEIALGYFLFQLGSKGSSSDD